MLLICFDSLVSFAAKKCDSVSRPITVVPAIGISKRTPMLVSFAKNAALEKIVTGINKFGDLLTRLRLL